MNSVQNSYHELIKEAFVDPIRTVTVIDDEYPSLITMMNTLEDNAKKLEFNPANITRIKNIIKMCHKDHKWSVDIYDGRDPDFSQEKDIPSHLHHSDLIILDYHLDGDNSTNDGKKALRIISDLDKNNHFNIILVHTKGTSTGDIKTVFNDILKELFYISKKYQPSEDIINKIEGWDDENDSEWLKNKYSLNDILDIYLKEISQEKNLINNKESLDIAKKIGIEHDELIKWKINEVIKYHKVKKSENDRTDIRWDWEDDGANYISTGKVFISVIAKRSDNPESELLPSLFSALQKHNASPMRLLMAKMRHELDEKGVDEAVKIIQNKAAQAGWLYSLLKNSKNNPSAHDKAINLHWELLARSCKEPLRKFSERIVDAAQEISSGNEKNFVSLFFPEWTKNQENILGHLNAFSCSMEVTGNHITTGSVLKISNKVEDTEEYWICLTPACDLEPGQRASQWSSRIGEDRVVFKAVKINEKTLKSANKNAQKNEYLFISIDGIPKAFDLGNGNPQWDVYYAENLGRFNHEKKITIGCIRKNIKDNLSEEKNNIIGELIFEDISAEVVAELRYEYALNFLHIFGTNQTRVGLDFISTNNFQN